MNRQDIEISEQQIEKDLSIDRLDLADEFLSQAGKYYYYASLYSQARRELDEAEEHEKVTRSRIIIETKEIDPKTTAVVMESVYRTDPRHIKAVEATIEATQVFNDLQNVVNALNIKKSSLEMLVKIQQSSLYSEPRKTPEFQEEVHETAMKKMILTKKAKENK